MNRSAMMNSDVVDCLDDCIQFLQSVRSYHAARAAAFEEVESHIAEVFGSQEVHSSPEISNIQNEVERRRKIANAATSRLYDALDVLDSG